MVARVMMLALVLVILGGGCVQDKKNPIAAAGAYPIIKEYQIQARQFEFVPNEIKVAAGTRIRLVVTSADVDHQLFVSGIASENEKIQGRTQTMELVAWPPGTYPILCRVVCGTGHDRMRGSLVIE